MKRIFCLVLCFALLSAVILPAQALDIWFVAVDDSIPLTLTGGSVPYYSGGVLYAPYSAFDSDSLSVFSIYDSSQHILAVYNIDHRLTFDLSAGTVTNLKGTSESVAAISRNGTVFVPVYYVAAYFGLGCAILEGSGGYPIMRLTTGNEIYDDEKFITQSQTLVDYRVSQYSSSQQTAPVVTPTPTPTPSYTPQVTPTPTVTPSSKPEDEQLEAPTAEPVTGANTALFLPGKSFGDLKDTLGDTPVLFTYSPKELDGADENIRAIICAGYDIALELDLDDNSLDILDKCNDTLFQAAKYTTMLVMADGRDEKAAEALESVGCQVWSNVVSAGSDFDITAYDSEVAVFVPEPKPELIYRFMVYMGYIGSEFIKVDCTTPPLGAAVMKAE